MRSKSKSSRIQIPFRYCLRLLLGSFAFLLPITDARPAVADCGFLGKIIGICESVDRLDKRLEATANLAAKTAQAAITAVPGERWLRLIDDLNSGDPDKKDKAQKFLASVAGIQKEDINAFEFSIGYDYDEKQHFKTDVARVNVPEKTALEAYLQFDSQFDPPTQTRLSPLNQDEVRQRLMQVADTVISAITGPANGIGINRSNGKESCPNPALDQYCAFVVFDRSIVSSGIASNTLLGAASSAKAIADAKVGSDDVVARKKEARAALANLVMEAISYSEARNDTKERHFDWPLLSERNFIVVFVDQETYDSQKDWKIQLKVNKKGSPEQTLFQRPVFTLTKMDFDPNGDNKPLRGRADQKIYWATREMTGDISATVAHVDDIKALTQAYAEWNKVVSQK